MQAWVEALSVKASVFGWAIAISNTPWFFNDWFRDWGELKKKYYFKFVFEKVQ